MIQDVFCDIYSSIRDRNAVLKRMRFYSLCRWLTRRIANITLPILFKLHPSKTTLIANHQPQTIVSLTSFPARIDKIWLVIECMLRQTVLPDKIILWLSKEQFSTIDVLPIQLRSLQSRGLDIQFEDGDIRSHKKYVHTLEKYPDANLITIDDDIFYRSTLIEELLRKHEQYPQAIIAQYTHNMRYKEDNSIMPYNQWENNAIAGDHLFFGSGGGTLFPPHTLHNDVTDTTLALKLCPNADDIWLNGMARLNNTLIVHTDRKEIHLPVLQRNNRALFDSNETGGNDIQIQQMMAYCMQHYRKNPFEKNKI